MNKWSSALRFIGLGWYVSASILLGVLGGRWLDGKLNTEPLLLIIGLFVGLLTAGYGVYKMLPTGNNEGNN